jgi:hypothetical protein
MNAAPTIRPRRSRDVERRPFRPRRRQYAGSRDVSDDIPDKSPADVAVFRGIFGHKALNAVSGVWAPVHKERHAGIAQRREAENEPNPDRKPPKVISPSDPCSGTAKANKRVQFGYGLNYLVDTENAVAVDVEPTPARTYDEVESTKTMLDRTERRLNLKPKRLAADTAYGTGRFLGWLVGRGIAPHIPVRDAGERDDGTLSRSDFRWDRRRGVYIYPNNTIQIKSLSRLFQVNPQTDQPNGEVPAIRRQSERTW